MTLMEEVGRLRQEVENAQRRQGFGGMAHGFPVGLAAHDDADERRGIAGNGHAVPLLRLIRWRAL